jgi:Cu/Ag efflux protein CusF
MTPSRVVVTGLFILLPFLAGCKGDATNSKPNEYEVKGTVVSVDANKPGVTLDHEDIPGVMKAMKGMPFKVQDRQILEGIKAGDQVHGRLKKEESGLVITELKKH